MRKVFGFLFTTVMPGVFYYGFYGSDLNISTHYCLNISKFIIWTTFLLSVLLFLGWSVNTEKVEKKISKEPRSYPLWYAFMTDMIGVFILAACGAFGYAGMWFTQAIIEQSIWGALKNDKTLENHSL